MCYLPLLPYICIKQNYNEIQKSNGAEQISYVAAHGITGRVCRVLVGEVKRPRLCVKLPEFVGKAHVHSPEARGIN